MSVRRARRPDALRFLQQSGPLSPFEIKTFGRHVIKSALFIPRVVQISTKREEWKMQKRFVLIAVVLVLMASMAVGQKKPVNVGRVFVTAPKPGMSKQLEEGRKRHMQFHQKQ